MQRQMFVQFEAAEIFVKKVLFSYSLVEKMCNESVYMMTLPIFRSMMTVCEKTYQEYEREYWQEQMKALEVSKNFAKAEAIKSQIQEKKNDQLRYDKFLRVLYLKKIKEEKDEKPLFQLKVDRLFLKKKRKDKKRCSTPLPCKVETSAHASQLTKETSDRHANSRLILNLHSTVISNIGECKPSIVSKPHNNNQSATNSVLPPQTEPLTTSQAAKSESPSVPNDENALSDDESVNDECEFNLSHTNHSNFQSCQSWFKCSKPINNSDLESSVSASSLECTHKTSSKPQVSMTDRLPQTPQSVEASFSSAANDNDWSNNSSLVEGDTFMGDEEALLNIPINDILSLYDSEGGNPNDVEKSKKYDNYSLNDSYNPNDGISHSSSFINYTKESLTDHSNISSQRSNIFPVNDSFNNSLDYGTPPILPKSRVNWEHYNCDDDVIIEEDSDDDCDLTCGESDVDTTPKSFTYRDNSPAIPAQISSLTSNNLPIIDGHERRPQQFTQDQVQELVKEMELLEIQHMKNSINEVSIQSNIIASPDIQRKSEDSPEVMQSSQSFIDQTTSDIHLNEIDKYERKTPVKQTIPSRYVVNDAASYEQVVPNLSLSLTNELQDSQEDPNNSSIFAEKSPSWSEGEKEFRIDLQHNGKTLLVLIRPGFSTYVVQRFDHHFDKVQKDHEQPIRKWMKLLKNDKKTAVIAKKELLLNMEGTLLNLMRPVLEHICQSKVVAELDQAFDADFRLQTLINKRYMVGVDTIVPYENRPFKWFVRKSFLHTVDCMQVRNEASLSNSLSMPAIWALPAKDRKDLLCNFLDGIVLSKYSGLPSELQLYVISLCYWYKNTRQDVDRCYVYTFLLSLVMFYFIDPCIGRVRNKQKLKSLLEDLENEQAKGKTQSVRQVNNFSDLDIIKYVCKKPDEYSCVFAALNLADYHKLPSDTTFVKKHVVHTLSEFQASFSYVGALNSLLGSPFLYPSIELVMNSTFTYNSFLAISKKTDPGLIIAEKLGRDEQLTHVFGALHGVVGPLLNLPMVLDLKPVLKRQEEDEESGKKVTKLVSKVPIRIRLRKEQCRMRREKVVAEIDKLVEEYESIGNNSKGDKNKSKKCTQTDRRSSKMRHKK